MVTCPGSNFGSHNSLVWILISNTHIICITPTFLITMPQRPIISLRYCLVTQGNLGIPVTTLSWVFLEDRMAKGQSFLFGEAVYNQCGWRWQVGMTQQHSKFLIANFSTDIVAITWQETTYGQEGLLWPTAWEDTAHHCREGVVVGSVRQWS